VNLKRHVAINIVLAALTLSWGMDGRTEEISTGAASELPQALFILPWQPRGKTPVARKRWQNKLPPAHTRTVDEQELNRQLNYHAILSRSAPVSAGDRDQGAQEE